MGESLYKKRGCVILQLWALPAASTTCSVAAFYRPAAGMACSASCEHRPQRPGLPTFWWPATGMACSVMPGRFPAASTVRSVAVPAADGEDGVLWALPSCDHILQRRRVPPVDRDDLATVRKGGWSGGEGSTAALSCSPVHLPSGADLPQVQRG